MNYCSLVQLSVVALVLLLLGNASRSLADDASTSPPAQAQTGTPPQDNAARVSPPAAASLITDGGFENGATGLSLLVPSGMGDKNCRFDIVSANPHSGTSCLRLQPINFGQLPIFYGGAVGYLSYEAVTHFEKSVPRAAKDDLQIPDACFMITDTLLIFDHEKRRIMILANAHVTGDPMESYDAAIKKIDLIQEQLERAIPHQLMRASHPFMEVQPEVNMTKDEYVEMVAKMQEFIRAGDIFQVVPSQRFEAPFTGSPMHLYRSLRLINPSPYMFCLKMPGLALVGSSPEVHVRCEEGCVTIRPIAGTRPRKADPVEDAAMAAELLADPKERAEHLMLVDLARNDVGRVCEFKSVRVTDFMTIERYSHVMHIVSNVQGRLQPDCNAYDVMRATFPAGTVSGAPKVRALQIISELEPTCRGSYAGAIGYFSFSGNLDSCIGIRTALLKDGKAYIQAGGGLVADSTPMGEYQESVNKAKAALKALALAKTFQD